MKYLNMLTGNIVTLAILAAWIAGVVLAKGFWLTVLAITIPFYAWYLIIEKGMLMTGVI